MTVIQRDFSLQKLNSLGVECIAEEYVEARSAEDLLSALGDANDESVPVTLLGGATNVVLLGRISGRVIRINNRGMSFEEAGDAAVRVKVASGETWHHLVRACLGRGIGGLENLALIPGTVGAAPIQNIGAYGRELSRFVESVAVIDTQSFEAKTLSPAQCAFRYRDSVFKSDEVGRYVVTGVTLRLGATGLEAGYPDVATELCRMGRTPSPNSIAEAVTRVRRRKLPNPREFGNVGSFFKNPSISREALDRLRASIEVDAFDEGGVFKVPAARLIEVAGWRAHRAGDAGVWPRQALVLVNYGRASGRQVLDLSRRIRDDVARRLGIELELEPSVLGHD